MRGETGPLAKTVDPARVSHSACGWRCESSEDNGWCAELVVATADAVGCVFCLRVHRNPVLGYCAWTYGIRPMGRRVGTFSKHLVLLVCSGAPNISGVVDGHLVTSPLLCYKVSLQRES